MFAIKCMLYHFILLIVLYTVIGLHVKENNHTIDAKQYSLISTEELKKISEQLFDKLPSNIFQSLNVNYQGKKYSNNATDEASQPLLTVPEHLFDTLPTLRLIRKLYDNYDINSFHAEKRTAEKISKENAFIDSLLDTSIMMHAMNFLASKGYFEQNLSVFKQILMKIWFGLYSRSNHTELGSSGFEHVFLVEKRKNKHISGLHNWIFFAIKEHDKRANYLGYVNQKQLTDKAAVIKFHLSYLNSTKLSSMFIGTLPEFEIAIYTLCFYAKPNKNCKIQLGNVKITIRSSVQFSNNGKYISSSFPKI